MSYIETLRASTTDVPNVPIAKYLAHLAHQTQNRVLSDVLNLKNYATLLQYHIKDETIRTTIAKSNIIILLRFSLSSSTDISLSIDSISFLLSMSLSISSLSSLLKKVAQDHSPVLAASLSSPCYWSRRIILHNLLPISPPHAPALVTDTHSPHR